MSFDRATGKIEPNTVFLLAVLIAICVLALVKA
jgi:hypothetical protein